MAGRDPERAVRFLRLAAERAFSRNAYPEGIRHLRSALDATDGLGGRLGAHARARSSCSRRSARRSWRPAAGRPPRPRQALLRARSLAGRLSDNEPLVSVLLALATLYELRGEMGRAQDMALECQRLAPSGGDEHELESSELLACNLFHQGSFARALEYAERGVELFEGGDSGSYSTFPATLGDNAGVSCHDWAGLALWFLGRPDAALARATHALELARDPSRAYSLATARAQMAVVHQCRREPEATLEWAEATIAAAQQLGYVYREAMGRVLRGWALALLGEQEQGIREITGGLAASRGTGARMDDPHYLALLGRGAPARRRDRRGARRGRRGARALAARALAVLRAGAAPAGGRAARWPPATSRRGRGGAPLRARPGARAGLRVAGAARSAPIWRGCWPTRSRPRRRARPVGAAYAGFDEGFDTRDLREAAAALDRVRR